MLCLCAAQLKFWFQTDLGRKIQPAATGREDRSLPCSRFLDVTQRSRDIRYYFIFPENARAYCIFYIYLAKPLSKVHVCNNRSNTDYDPQDILLHCRMVNKIG